MAAPDPYPYPYPYPRSSRTPAPQQYVSFGTSAAAAAQPPPRRGSGVVPVPMTSPGALAEEDDVLRPLPARRTSAGMSIHRSTTAPPQLATSRGPIRQAYRPAPPPVPQPVHTCPRPYCGKSFSTLSDLDMHIREHLRADNPCACPYPRCYQRFKLPSQVKDHYKSHFEEPEVFYCQNNRCGKQFDSQQEVERHMRNKHPSMFVR